MRAAFVRADAKRRYSALQAREWRAGEMLQSAGYRPARGLCARGLFCAAAWLSRGEEFSRLLKGGWGVLKSPGRSVSLRLESQAFASSKPLRERRSFPMGRRPAEGGADGVASPRAASLCCV